VQRHEKPERKIERNSYQESRPSKTNWGEKSSFLLPEDGDTGSFLEHHIPVYFFIHTLNSI
jgi:hypothetical protein